MCKHEEKFCPRCNNTFECKVGDIMHCQCYGIKCTEGEMGYIAVKYLDCLCAECMFALKSEYNISQRELQINGLLNGR